MRKTAIEIRFSDQDSQGHVHHEAIVGYVAHARVSFLDGLVAESGAPEIDYVLVNLNVDFIAEINHPGVVDVSSSVARIGTKSVTTRYDLSKDGKTFAAATSVNVFFNTETKETVAIPDALKSLLAAHVAAG